MPTTCDQYAGDYVSQIVGCVLRVSTSLTITAPVLGSGATGPVRAGDKL